MAPPGIVRTSYKAREENLPHDVTFPADMKPRVILSVGQAKRWYPEVPAVDTRQLADLLHSNEQIIRAWVREGILPAHRQPGGRKFTFLRHKVFQWLISNRYNPNATDEAP